MEAICTSRKAASPLLPTNLARLWLGHFLEYRGGQGVDSYVLACCESTIAVFDSIQWRKTLVLFCLKCVPPVISETKQVGIFCLLTNCLLMIVGQLLFSTFKIFSLKIFQGDPEAQNTINSSLRSKNFWISIFLCMRHI